jgi:hypothetical protein
MRSCVLKKALLGTVLVSLTIGWLKPKPLGLTRISNTKEIVFTDVTHAAGINFSHVSSANKKYIVESMGGGVAIFDFDNDGWMDIYLTNSQNVEAALVGEAPAHAGLYRNRGDGTFEDFTLKTGVADPGWAMGVSVADYDNDGFDDLYITCFGPNRLYHNRGDGTFEDVTTKAGVGDPRFSTGAAWGDFDRDGYLDLFVANYVDFRLDQLPQFGKGTYCQYKGVPVQCGPRGLRGAGDALYHNNGDGTFTDVSKAAGVDDPAGYYGLGVMWTDLDDDGWPDIIVANDGKPNYAYRNNHDGTFKEVGYALGIATDENGVAKGNMGLSLGDYDRDGRMDLIVTDFSDESNTVYHKNPDGTFTDVSVVTKTAAVSIPYVGWGTKFFDFDNDGWLDLLVVNGHVYPQIEGAYPGGMYRQRKLLYINLHNGTFEEVASSLGSALLERQVSRGAAFGDLDKDGDVDVVVNNLDGPPMLLRNDGGSKVGHWLELKLTGTIANRNAVGTKVKLTAGGLTQIDEVHSGDSYLSHSDWALHFGLGDSKFVDEIAIDWPDGKVEKLRGLPSDQVLAIIEGKSGECSQRVNQK